MTGLSMRRPASMAAGLVVALAAAGVAYGGWVASSAGSAASNSSQVSAVEAAFSQAEHVNMSYGSPSAAYQRSVMGAVHAGRTAFVVPAPEQSHLLASGQAAIARYFGPPQASVELGSLNDAMAVDSDPNIINLGSGVSKVQFLHVSVAGSKATVEADVTVWAKSEARQVPTGPWLFSDPVNVVDDTASLALSPSGTWQVTSLSGSFVPGYGP
jgi:hypothetical protein